MSRALILLLVVVSTVAFSEACYRRRRCTSNCQWTSWSNVGSCSASCGHTGTIRQYRKEIQRGTCSSSKCSKSQTYYKTCIAPCVHGAATGFGCLCPQTYTGRCCELVVRTTTTTTTTTVPTTAATPARAVPTIQGQESTSETAPAAAAPARAVPTIQRQESTSETVPEVATSEPTVPTTAAAPARAVPTIQGQESTSETVPAAAAPARAVPTIQRQESTYETVPEVATSEPTVPTTAATPARAVPAIQRQESTYETVPEVATSEPTVPTTAATPVPTIPTSGDEKCTIRAGTCQEDSSSCSGVYWSGFCAGGVNRRCCIPDSVDIDNKCIEAVGHCQSDVTCVGGHYTRSLCAGNTNRKCCILDGQATSTEDTPSDGTKLPEGNCSDVTIVTREEWGAQTGKQLSAIARNPPKILFMHHEGSGDTCTNDCAQRVRDIQAAHLKKWSDIGYNYLVGDDGRAYEGRGWNYSGAHTWGYNSIAVAICAIGNFEEEKPSQTILQTIANLIACAVDEGSLSQNYELFGHGDGGQTACPGKYLYDVIKNSAHFSHRKIPRYNSIKETCVENCNESKEI